MVWDLLHRSVNRTHLGLGLLDMFVSEQELTVQVGEVDRVQVNYVDFAEPGQKEVLQ